MELLFKIIGGGTVTLSALYQGSQSMSWEGFFKRLPSFIFPMWWAITITTESCILISQMIQIQYQLEFLNKFLDERNTKGNIESQEDEVKEQEQEHNEEEQSNEQNAVNDENPPIVELETKDESRQFSTPKAYLTTSNKRKKVNASQQSASSQLMEYLLQEKSEPSNSSVRKVDSVDAFLTGIGSTLTTLSPYYLNLVKSEIFQTVQKYELQMITAPAYRSNQSFHGENRSSSSETPCVSQYPNVTSPCDMAESPAMYSNTSTRTSTPLSSPNPDVDQQHPRAKKTVQLMEDLETAVGKSNLPYKQVELFSLQVYVENFKFSVFGYFPLDWTLLHSMVAGVATYLVIFHQFSNMEKNV
ncbi:hypothetical protein FQR65_LT17689 [Abscondita terminalis]|nr:hypothetical protein FQR65_LT17689 [Abscondita terminalis]